MQKDPYLIRRYPERTRGPCFACGGPPHLISECTQQPPKPIGPMKLVVPKSYYDDACGIKHLYKDCLSKPNESAPN